MSNINLNIQKEIESTTLPVKLKLSLSILKDSLGVCYLDKNASIPYWALEGKFFSITRTQEELSIVCNDQAIPIEVTAEKDWRCIKVEGPLDFSLVGIISALTKILAEEGISVFVVSTYMTDYILVKAVNLDKAVAALIRNGHKVSVNQYN